MLNFQDRMFDLVLSNSNAVVVRVKYIVLTKDWYHTSLVSSVDTHFKEEKFPLNQQNDFNFTF